MKRDFTCRTYQRLLTSLARAGFEFLRFEEYMTSVAVPQQLVILRHDIDRRPKHARAIAGIERNLNIRATYYFRIVSKSYDVETIKHIASLGHEIGYHYEDLHLARGDFQNAYSLYKNNLAKVRELYPVRTVCMHGSPLSRWDNRALWNQYDYKVDGVVGEPYLDVDFNKVYYLTDTGRTWKQSSAVIRDRVESTLSDRLQTTFDIIEQANQGKLPSRLMINTHPERWDDRYVPWIRQAIGQNLKNPAKYLLSKVTSRRRTE